MPPASIICGCSSGEKELDHWQTGACSLLPQRQGWYNSMLTNRLTDKAHAGGNVTITRLLDCPRKPLIQDFLPYPFEPTSQHKMHLGTLVQREIAQHLPAGYQAEVEVRGRLFGLEVSGRIDILGPGIINEGKFHGLDKMRRIMGETKWSPAKELLSEEQVAQTNMQRLLLEQTVSIPEDAAFVGKMVVSHSSDSHPDWPSEQAPLRDEDWVGNVQPCKGGFKVREIAAFLGRALEEIRGGCPAAEAIGRVPKVGETMFANKSGNNMCKSWCSRGVAGVCQGI